MASTEVEEFTPEQEKAISDFVKAFGVKHGEITLKVKVYKGDWREAIINPERKILRTPPTRCTI
ncbi:MAG: hypothetical protein ACYC27_03040 [Armatimonadota bacterium]